MPWRRQNYPLIKKHDLIARTSNYSIENAGKGWLPQFSCFRTGQLSVTDRSTFRKQLGAGPGLLIPPLSKDQYKIQAEVDQNIFDGGRIKNEKDMIQVNEASQQQSLEVALYQLNDRINQLYFSILLIDEQIRQNDISKDRIFRVLLIRRKQHMIMEQHSRVTWMNSWRKLLRSRW